MWRSLTLPGAMMEGEGEKPKSELIDFIRESVQNPSRRTLSISFIFYQRSGAMVLGTWNVMPFGNWIILNRMGGIKQSSETTHGGFQKWGYPNSWMVYFMDNPNLTWMRTRGTPISGHLQMKMV